MGKYNNKNNPIAKQLSSKLFKNQVIPNKKKHADISEDWESEWQDGRKTKQNTSRDENIQSNTDS